MDRWQSFFFSILASIFVWSIIIGAKLITNDSELIEFASVAAIGGNLAIWLVWIFTIYGDNNKAADTARDKAKRTAPAQAAPEDARLALLLQLMDDEDRRDLKRRLMDDLSADGETVALADLLAAQEERLRRTAR